MEWIVVDGLKPYDGRYEFGFVAELTTREWGWIKRHAGYMPMSVLEGLEGGDPELFAIFAVIALRRAGRIETPEVAGLFERFGDATFGSTIRIESDGVEEDDASPPALSSNGKQPSSGDASPASSETSPPAPPASGIPASATSESGRPSWVT